MLSVAIVIEAEQMNAEANFTDDQETMHRELVPWFASRGYRIVTVEIQQTRKFYAPTMQATGQ